MDFNLSDDQTAFVESAGAFSAGVLAVTLLIAGAFVADCVWRRRVAPPPLELPACFGPAFLSGVLWNVGNVGSIWAVLPLGGAGRRYILMPRAG